MSKKYTIKGHYYNLPLTKGRILTVSYIVKLKGRIILAVTFKVKFMFEFAILYIIFNIATSIINKMSI